MLMNISIMQKGFLCPFVFPSSHLSPKVTPNCLRAATDLLADMIEFYMFGIIKCTLFFSGFFYFLLKIIIFGHIYMAS